MNSKYRLEEEKEYEKKLKKRVEEARKADEAVFDTEGDVRPVVTNPLQRERYVRIKNRVLEIEEDNYSHIVIFDSGNGWYKMGGHSLLIYYFAIARKILDFCPTIQPDTDYTRGIFKEGIICLRGTIKTEDRLKKAGVLAGKVEKGGVVVFKLNFTVTKKEIEDYTEEMRFLRDTARAVIAPAMPTDPPLYKRLRHVQKRCYEVARRTTVYDRDYSGLLIADYGRRMTKIYLLMHEGVMDEIEALSEIYKLAKKLLIEIGFVVDLCIWRQDIAVAVGGEVLEIKRAVEKKLREENKRLRVEEVD